MDSLLTQVIAWPSLLIALIAFGFAPGAMLRLIVLAFKPGDPRRRELLGELPHVPRLERPFWVFEQLEVAAPIPARDSCLDERQRHSAQRSARGNPLHA